MNAAFYGVWKSGMMAGCTHTDTSGVARSWFDRMTRRVRDLPCGDTWVYLEVEIRRVECKTCGKVKQETVDWLAQPVLRHTLAFFVGRRCRPMTIKDVPKETRLDWKTIKALDAQYLQEQFASSRHACAEGHRDR